MLHLQNLEFRASPAKPPSSACRVERGEEIFDYSTVCRALVVCEGFFLMANRTDPSAKSIHGTNPQNLVEKIVRSKIYQNTYWKEQCFGLTAETLVDKAMELDHLGGTFGGNRKPTPFLCLVMKMLQIQPEKEIVVEFIKNEDYKFFNFSTRLLSIRFFICFFTNISCPFSFSLFIYFLLNVIRAFVIECRYVRILGAFYLRLTGSVTDVYQYLEPLYNDYRKLRLKLSDGSKALIL